MEPVALDPCGYPGTYKLIGGRLSLDLANTVSWPGTDREHDWLRLPQNLERWLQAVGLAPVPARAVDLDDVAAVRHAIAGALRPLAHGDEPHEAAIAALNRQLGPAAGRRRVAADLSWTWAAPTSALEALAPVVVDAAEVVVEVDRDRLRYCPACDWLFLDTSRNGRRRWCDMADCGSRAKARSYYQRHK